MLTRFLAAAFLILALSLHPSAHPWADEIAGRARVIDGDTIEIAGKRIRLFGIDAPESRQTCGSEGKVSRCGQEATSALSNRLGAEIVVCDDRGRDRYGRIVAVCRLGGSAGPDINAWMVREGWAIAYRRYSRDYVAAEGEAEAAKRGLWSGTFEEPWEWRRQRRQ
jgi:endonuclease YncB( thermonuclease family)